MAWWLGMVWYVIVEYPRATIAFWGRHVLRILTVHYTIKVTSCQLLFANYIQACAVVGMLGEHVKIKIMEQH